MRGAITCLAVMLAASCHCAPLTERADPPSPSAAGAPVELPQWVGTALGRMKVPRATNTSALPATSHPQVVVDGSSVVVDGEVVASVPDIIGTGRMSRVDGLHKKLKDLRESFKRSNPPSEAFSDTVLVWMDEETPALVVKSVFQTIAYAGYPQISFGVRDARTEKLVRMPAIDTKIPGPPDLHLPPPLMPGLSVKGALPPAVVSRIVQQNQPWIDRCRDAAHQRAKLVGDVTVAFGIDEKGVVSSAADKGSTVRDRQAIACVVDFVRRMTFPPPEGGVVTVELTIPFARP